MKVLAEYSTGRDNNFNLIRLVAALMVMWDHSYAIAGVSEAEEPLARLIGMGSSFIAVNVFFVISGYLVTASLCRSKTLLAYVEARFLRIFPGLFLCVAFTSLVIGGLFTSLSAIQYYRSRELWDYVIVNSTLLVDKIQLRYYLPGVFANNPLAGTVNGSLWTLPYEVWLYVGLAGVGLLGLLKRTNLSSLLLAGLLAFDLSIMFFFPTNALVAKFDNVERFCLYFFLGAVIYLNRARIPLSGPILLILCAVTAIVWRTGFAKFLSPFTLAYLVFWLAYVPRGVVRLYNRVGDLSYGTYIYAWPVQQVIVTFVSAVQPLFLFLLALPVTLSVAAISWHLVEKRALARKGVLLRAVQGRRAEA